MSRNQSRIFADPANSHDGTTPEQKLDTANNNPFSFIVPTEMVDIPSKGKFYPEGHPLHNQDCVEVKHMTAKEEDILTSLTLLKKGVALDKMLQSIIVDKRVKVEDLLIGDKNALLVASRIYGYGPHYQVELTCPSCDVKFEHVFDLNNLKNQELKESKAVTKTDHGTFIMTLPRSNFEMEFRLLTSGDESATSNKTGGTLSLLKLITVSVNEQTDPFYVERALQSLPILDVSIYKKAYASVMPDVDMIQSVDCTECGEASDMGVPLNADFFWPNV